MSAPEIFSPRRIAELVAAPGAPVFEPSEEQKSIITAPQSTPLLVIAGAGSGKTETMSQRVMWLIANGFVSPEHVLGLTFTRKAAGELAERLRLQLHRLRDALPATLEATHAQTQERVAGVVQQLSDFLSLPEVSTYNAFAGSLISEFGDEAGIRAEAVVIDEPTAWQIARDVVNASADLRLAELGVSTNTLIDLVLGLHRQMAEHLRTSAQVREVAEEFLLLAQLPYSDREGAEKQQPDLSKALASVGMLPALLDLADAYAAEKRRRGVIEFSDQVAQALHIVRTSLTARETLRTRYPVVLLDEYQDTSVGQTELLATLFAAHGVTAVGDPHQSIYGWRGASAANLSEFGDQFGMTEAPMSLSVSWRNSQAVLAAANMLVAPLSERSALQVRELSARPGAPEGAVRLAFEDSVQDEAVRVAEWLRGVLEASAAAGGAPATAAMLFRQRALMPFFSEVLTEFGIPNEIVGVGGLLSTPEVTDLLCALRCVWRIDAGSELIRLLAGPRWRVGVADLGGLREAAYWLSERDHTYSQLSETEQLAQRDFDLPQTPVTILEALDELRSVQPGHRMVRSISDEGLSRLRDAADVFAHLRSKSALPLPDLVRLIERELRLDIELAANESKHRDAQRSSRANLDAFLEIVEQFVSIDPEGTLPNFLDWSDRALRDDAFAEQATEPSPGAVQLITVHGAKGLEWDYVAVPRLVADEFPARPKSLSGWFTSGQLPFELRGDARSLPQLAWSSLDTKLEFKRAFAAFREAIRASLDDEERRLVYVACTRAKSELLLSGSWWSHQTREREPSIYLRELEHARLIPQLPSADGAPERPADREHSSLTWPLDPLGGRAERVRRAAEAVRQAQLALASDGERGDLSAFPELALLLAERDQSGGRVHSVLPERISASAFKDAVTDPEGTRRKLLRPLPERPYRQAKIGTLFHQWVEYRYASAVGSMQTLDLDGYPWEDDGDPGDEVSSAGSTDAAPDQLAALQEKFLASEWGMRAPLALEQEITMPFAGRTLVCKIDAIYEPEPGQFQIVDWKTGRPPENESDAALRLLQLELYRHAFASWRGIPPERIECVLFYVATGEVLRSERMLSVSELESQWLQAFGEVGG